MHTSPMSTMTTVTSALQRPRLESTIKTLIIIGNTGMLQKSRESTKESKRSRAIDYERTLVYYKESPRFDLQN